MRVLIDMQGAQAASRTRGIGRYSREFALAVAKHGHGAELHVLLSLAFPESAEELRDEFLVYLPANRIHVWQPPHDIRGLDPAKVPMRHAAELILTCVVASLKPDVVHFTSPMEGFSDDAVFGLHPRKRDYVTTATLYDLIPMINSRDFLDTDARFSAFYNRQLNSLKKVDGLLAISKSSLEEGLRFLSDSPLKAVNVGSGVSKSFIDRTASASEGARVLKTLGVEGPYVLYFGGFDDRKNVNRLIEAFATMTPQVRGNRQLVLAGWIDPEQEDRLHEVFRRTSMKLEADVLITGIVSDAEAAILMAGCELFVFPSLHEGLGLAPLEAMNCGAPVITSNSTSLPEIVGLPEAMFDPLNVDEIRARIERALVDEKFRESLITNAKRQSKNFTWEKSSRQAISFWKRLLKKDRSDSVLLPPTEKPRLLIIGPLPPAESGVADYIAELAPGMSPFYDVFVIVADKSQMSEDYLGLEVRDVHWFLSNALPADRVMYHMGNSPFHALIPNLMKLIPGTLVLHDFFLGSLYEWLQVSGTEPDAWTREIYLSHGYRAVCLSRLSPQEAKKLYPSSLSVLQYATGVITHSQHSRDLGRHWFSDVKQENWEIVPLLRDRAESFNRTDARRDLNIPLDSFVICAFGFVDQTKLNHLLIQAWLSSRASDNPHNLLILVGGDGGPYSETLSVIAREGKRERQVISTGYVSKDDYRRYLSAADVAVQLRTDSRGETSAAVLDCLNYGIPTIVNAHGSMEELDPSEVVVLPDSFQPQELVDAIERLMDNPEIRQRLSESGKKYIQKNNGLMNVVELTARALERHHLGAGESVPGLIHGIKEVVNSSGFSRRDINNLADSISQSLPLEAPLPTIFLDITSTRELDIRTGVQRVAKAILCEMIISPPPGYRIEPVYLHRDGNRWDYFYARKYADEMMGQTKSPLSDERASIGPRDVVLCLDLSGPTFVQAAEGGLFRNLKIQGVSLNCIAFDMLPITNPEVFPPGVTAVHEDWLEIISQFDVVAAISSTAAKAITNWLDSNRKDRRMPSRVVAFPLGADFHRLETSPQLTSLEGEMLMSLNDVPIFLMVGTIEPRKGYDQALEAFTQLWAGGVKAHLVIVGKSGWSHMADIDRKNIPEIEKILREHPEANHYLHWVGQASDILLEELYARSQCLLAASYGEGFGLPLIEAAHHGLPILARDIPVFREVAGTHATYFVNGSAEDLATGVRDWLAASAAGETVASASMPYLSWAESAKRLTQVLLSNRAASV